MIQGQELELSLGLPIEITSFNDNLPRLCYPYTLSTLKRANIYLSNFDHKNLLENLKSDRCKFALLTYLKESFKDEENIEDLLSHVDIDCFEEVIKDMKSVSGIIDGKGEIDVEKTTSTVGWQKSVNAIQTYTSNTHLDIKEMTLRQFNSLLPFIGAVINWEYKTNTISIVSEPNKYIDKEEHPLAVERVIEHKNHMTMKDIEGFKNL